MSVSLMQQQQKKPSGFSSEFLRIPTGVKGFDELVEGGLPESSLVIVTGGCGTGKSIFAMNFLVEGALRNEPGVYVSLEEDVQENIKEMMLFEWPIEQLISEKKLLITQPELYDFDKLVTHIEDAATKMKAKRIVIDSSSLIGLYFKDAFKVRRAMIDLENMLKRLKSTAVVINEIKEGDEGLSTYGVEEFIADGVIVLYCQKKENLFARAVAIRKMRATNHSMKIHPMQIRKPGGIVVFPSEEVFTEF